MRLRVALLALALVAGCGPSPSAGPSGEAVDGIGGSSGRHMWNRLGGPPVRVKGVPPSVRNNP
jgi:hypothetical protein